MLKILFFLAAFPCLAHDFPAGADRTEQLLKAKATVETQLQADPSNIELWRRLGLLSHKLTLVDEAEKAFNKVLELNPKDPGAYFMLALIYEKKKLKEQAISAWENCLKYAENLKMQAIAKKHLEHLKSQ